MIQFFVVGLARKKCSYLSMQRRILRLPKRKYLLVTLSVVCLLIVGVFAFKILQRRIVTVNFNIESREHPDWFYFPIIDRNSHIVIPASYSPVVDWYGYNRSDVTLSDPAYAGASWSFKRSSTDDRYGFVFRLWPFKKEPDDSSARVFWVSKEKMNEAIKTGTLRLPRIETLPRFSDEDFERLSNSN